ncbi:type IV pilus modification PilV family protein [Planococcus ruber]|uniref:type IV pilus modification PilV family protein n=1 Tax=Planococcus ruber TaxID=2027871 RepID=UPI001FED922E|nr:prepilin-type N-terminal cleavage/methylation domain-containing protein [Planococcus ruber]MCJ1908635.1 prepilin-type N-terminal cleavage/methylation domain-containing protein [Planococcus ruber]
MIKTLNSQKGLTLVEILAATVILGIVLISFMSFFAQSAKFTVHNSEKLTAVEVAEDVMGEIRQGKTAIPHNKYKNFEISVTVASGPANTKLAKAIITVKNTSQSKMKSKDFVTEMYFNPAGGVAP